MRIYPLPQAITYTAYIIYDFKETIRAMKHGYIAFESWDSQLSNAVQLSYVPLKLF